MIRLLPSPPKTFPLYVGCPTNKSLHLLLPSDSASHLFYSYVLPSFCVKLFLTSCSRSPFSPISIHLYFRMSFVFKKICPDYSILVFVNIPSKIFTLNYNSLVLFSLLGSPPVFLKTLNSAAFNLLISALVHVYVSALYKLLTVKVA